MKTRLPLIASLICLLLASMAAQSTTASSAAESEVRSLIQEVDSALKSHDGSKLERLMAGDFVMLHSTGKVEDRKSYLERASAGSLASQRVPAEVLEDNIRLYDGRTALRTTRIKATLHPADRAPVEMSLRSLDVYVKIEGRWLWVSEQSTPIPAEAVGQPPSHNQ